MRLVLFGLGVWKMLTRDGPAGLTCRYGYSAMTILVVALVSSAGASTRELKALSLEELFEVTVTTPGRRPEPLYRTASAVTVLRSDDLRRAGVRHMADALRLVPGMQVSRVNGRTWAVSARGFTLSTANKLEVVFDGRSVYTSFFGGTYWDIQDTLIEDIEQIEVIRGPGGTLWGANAVNGVVNIMTKSARDTQGDFVHLGGGKTERALAAVRHGFRVGDKTFARIYGSYARREWTIRADGRTSLNQTDQEFSQTGFRLDSYPSAVRHWTFQGDFYTDRIGFVKRIATDAAGGNLSGRWHADLDNGSLDFLAYHERAERVQPSIFEEMRDTSEISLQHRFPVGERHNLVWGLQGRLSMDDVNNVGATGLLPEERTVHLLSIYAQDEIVPTSMLRTIVGFKLEHNSFSRLEFQPNVRFVWEPVSQTILWGAISRAVRTPVRADHNLVTPVRSARPIIRANADFDAEKLTAFEWGFRREFTASMSLDVAAYYNVYDDLRSQERASGPTSPFAFKNNLEGETYGFETSFLTQLTPALRATLGYGYLQKHLRFRPGTVDPRGVQAEGNDAKHIGSLRLAADLTRKITFDVILRGVSSLPIPRVPGYLEVDARLAYFPADRFEVALVGRDLADDQHPEFGTPGPRREELQRSLFAEISWRY